MATGTNLVIQQLSDVGRLQQMVQKSGEAQQLAAAQEQAQKTQEERSQVQKTEHSAADNKVDKDGKQEREKKRQSAMRQAKGEAKDQPFRGAMKTGLLDIIV